jgi:hypothetical protein
MVVAHKRKVVPLLGVKTAQYLGILKIGLMSRVQTQSGNDWYVKRFTEVFTGIEKIKWFQLKSPIDSKVRPVVQETC